MLSKPALCAAAVVTPSLADALPLGVPPHEKLPAAASPKGADGKAAAKTPPFAALSSMFEGVYKGVGSFSSDAVGAIQRATGRSHAATAVEDSGADVAVPNAAADGKADSSVGQIRYPGLQPTSPSQELAGARAQLEASVLRVRVLARSCYLHCLLRCSFEADIARRVRAPSNVKHRVMAGDGTARAAGTATISMREWRQQHSTAPCSTQVKVLVPTTDRLVRPQRNFTAATSMPQARSSSRRLTQSAEQPDRLNAHDKAALRSEADEQQAPAPLRKCAGGQDKSEPSDQMALISFCDAEADAASGGHADQGDDDKPDSPVGLWISPQQAAFSNWQRDAASSPPNIDPFEQHIEHAAPDAQQQIDNLCAQMLSEVAAVSSSSRQAAQGIGGGSFQFSMSTEASEVVEPELWPLSRSFEGPPRFCSCHSDLGATRWDMCRRHNRSRISKVILHPSTTVCNKHLRKDMLFLAEWMGLQCLKQQH